MKEKKGKKYILINNSYLAKLTFQKLFFSPNFTDIIIFKN